MAGGPGLQRRWLRNTISLVAAIMLTCVAGLSVTVAAYYYSSMEASLQSRARTGTSFFETYIGQSYSEYYRSCAKFAESFESKDMLELQFVNTNYRVVASSYTRMSAKAMATSDVTQAIETKEISSYTGVNPATGERIMAVSSPLIYSNGEVIGVLRYVTSLSQVDRQITYFSLLVLLVGALILLVIYLSGSYYVRSILIPVSDITATAKRIAAGSYGVQINQHFDDEIGELANTINDMSNKISQSERMQSEFMSSVSHELRTPLTAISGWSETLLSADAAADGPQVKRGLGIILRESRRLTSMVEELDKDYVRTALGAGIPRGTVIARNVLRNALITPVTVLGMRIGYLIGGAVVIEVIFNLPGMGMAILEGVQGNYPALVQGVTLTVALTFIVINVAVDLLYVLINPRMRTV